MPPTTDHLLGTLPPILSIYARAISIIQSSGMGKSRLLTEVRLYSIGRHHLTESLLGWQAHLHAPHLSPLSA